jgi:hypothetical protein
MKISVFILRKGKCVSIFGNKDEATVVGSSVVSEYEKVLLLPFLGKNIKYRLYQRRIKSDYNSTISSMYCIGSLSPYGLGWACGIRKYSPSFIYVFQLPKTSFLLCSTKRGLCLHPVYLWLGLVFSYSAIIPSLLKLAFGIVITIM